MRQFIQENGEVVINSLDNDGYTPMHYAVYESTLEIVEYLFKFDVDFDNHHGSKTGQRPIHWACIKGRIEMINILRKFVDSEKYLILI